MSTKAASAGDEATEPFRYASLEPEPEKEFEHAKWIVLTTAQPYIEDDTIERGKSDKHSESYFERKSQLGNSL